LVAARIGNSTNLQGAWTSLNIALAFMVETSISIREIPTGQSLMLAVIPVYAVENPCFETFD
jgi:hypothetical protein